MSYEASLIIDGTVNAGCSAPDLESVTNEIFHYARMYIQDGFEKKFEIVIKKKA
jgi:hypothetical protein